MRSNSHAIHSQTRFYSTGQGAIAVTEQAPHPSRRPLRGTLIFLTGRFAPLSHWRELIESLSIHFRCLLIEPPGVGRSLWIGEGLTLQHWVKALAAVIADNSDGPLVLVGHDLGGAFAQACALESDERVRGLILVNPNCLTRPWPVEKMGWRALLLRRKLRKALALAMPINEDIRKEILRRWDSKDERDACLRAIHAIRSSWPTEGEQSALKVRMGHARQPMLLLWGARDVFHDPDVPAELVRNVPEIYYFRQESCGHWICAEDPRWVLSRIRSFLSRILSAEREFLKSRAWSVRSIKDK